MVAVGILMGTVMNSPLPITLRLKLETGTLVMKRGCLQLGKLILLFKEL
jgi:hypothetical protein